MKHILKKSFDKVIVALKKHRWKIFTIFALQLVFFISIFYVNINYQVKILDDARVIFQTLEEQELGDEALAENIADRDEVIKGSITILNRAKNITRNLTIMAGISLALYIIVGGLLWAFTDNIVNRKKKIRHYINYVGKFIAVSFFYLMLIFIVLVFAFTGSTYNYLWLILVPLLLYFMFISYSLIGKLGLFKIAKKTWHLGTRKAHYVVAAYIINILVIVILGAFMFMLAESFILLLAFALLLFVFGYSLARLFLVEFVHQLAHSA